jgi:fibronectin type 3 domain-containing protein
MLVFAACAGADDGGNASSVGAPVSAPGIPTNVQAAALSATSVSVTWNPVAGATSYNVYYIRQALGDTLTLAGQVNQSPHTCTGLASDTAYYFFVKAVNTAGESLQGDPASARTLLAAPGVPSGVTAVAASANSITVNWTAVQGAAKYKLYYAIGGDSAAKVQVGESVAVTYTHEGLQANAPYYYYVVAVNASGESGYSVTTALSHTAPLLAPPSAPAGVTATALTPTSIRVTWSAGTYAAERYKVYVAEGAYSAEKILVTEILDTSYTQGELFPGRAYYYYVTAVNAVGEGGYSAYTTASFARTPLAAPLDVTAAAATTSSITITWAAATGAENYKIYYATGSADAQKIFIAQLAATAYTHTGLLPNVPYYYYVVSCAPNVESGYSALTANSHTAPLLTPPSAPAGVTATALSSTSISVTWTAVAYGAASYKVYAAEGSYTGEKNLITEIASGTSYTHTGLTPGASYYYYITAVNAAGDSGYSENTVQSWARTLTAPDPPASARVTLSNNNDGMGYWVNIAWDAVPGAASYRVYYVKTYTRNTSNNPPANPSLPDPATLTKEVLESSATALTYIRLGTTFPATDFRETYYLSGAGAWVPYDYHNYFWFYVTAVNAAGESTFSPPSISYVCFRSNGGDVYRNSFSLGN